MLDNLKRNRAGAFLLVLLVGALAGVRTFENELFYDPLLNYFKRDFTNLPLPPIDMPKLVAGIFFRYFLNSAISIAIIYVLFRKRDLVKFTLVLYAIFFVLLIAVFFFVLRNFSDERMVVFYIRRFLIQPLLLLLFIPGFYFQERGLGKK